MNTEVELEHLSGKKMTLSMCNGCHCMTKTVKGKCGKCKASKFQKTYSHEEVLEIIQNLPKVQKSLQIALQTVLSVLEDVAMVIRAIPPEMIREAVEMEMNQKLKSMRDEARPTAIVMNAQIDEHGLKVLQQIVDRGMQIPVEELK